MCEFLLKINWLSVKEVISSLSNIILIVLGIIGLTTWKRQLKGSHQYEIARKLMFNAYKVEQSIKNCRNPMMYLSKEEVDNGNHLKEKEKIYNERYAKLNDDLIALNSFSLEAKVIFGKKIEDLVSELNKIISELRSELWLYFWLQGYYAGPETTIDRNPERTRKNQEIIFYISDDDNFSLKVKEKISAIEQFLYQTVFKNL